MGRGEDRQSLSDVVAGMGISTNEVCSLLCMTITGEVGSFFFRKVILFLSSFLAENILVGI